VIPDCFWIDEFPARDLEWLVEGIISPHINILSGQPKAGKSTLAMALSLAIINGKPIFGRRVGVSGSVAWMGYDSGWAEELRSKIGNKANNRLLLQRPFDLTLSNESKFLGSRLRDLDCKLLVVDHLYGFSNLHNLDINNQRDASRALEGIRIINSDYEIPVLLIAQATKGNYGAVAHSNAIKGMARVLIEMTGTSISGKRTIKIIGNELETRSLFFKLSAENLISEIQESSKSNERDRDFSIMMERTLQALNKAQPEDLLTISSFGRLFERLGYSKTSGGGRKMVQRYIEMGLLSEEGGKIKKGRNLGT
jgi:hypothetical protein